MIKITPSYTLSFFLLAIAGCQWEGAARPDTNSTRDDLKTQQQLSVLGEQLQVTYQVLDNRPGAHCDKNRADGLCFQSQLLLTMPEDWQAGNWSMYFSHMSPIQRDFSDDFDIEFLNGDLHRLTPTSNFEGFEAGQPIAVPLQADYWHLAKTDIMPNYYVVSGSLQPELVNSTIARIDDATGLEILPHAGGFTEQEKHLKRSSGDQTLFASAENQFRRITTDNIAAEQLRSEMIPTPRTIEMTDGKLDISRGIKLTGQIPSLDAIDTALQGLSRLGVHQSEDGAVVSFRQLADESLNSPEAYRLEISAAEIEISFKTAVGAHYALRSLASLLFVGETQLPALRIADSPRYPFRGMHLDVARNFRDKHYVIRLLEQMARYKLNRLHLHLGDDEGWRVEIPDLPELTDIGSQRCHDPEEKLCIMPQLGSGPFAHGAANGYYSRRDYQEILHAAQARHIEVIPSFDMPGHSRAAVAAMEARYQRLIAAEQPHEASRYRLIDPLDKTVYQSIQYYNDNTLNVCLDSSYTFVEKVIDEMITLHAQAGVPLTRYHIGADETAGAWIQSPACESLLTNPDLELEDHHDLTGYFVERVANMVADKGVMPAGWNDGLSTTDTGKMPNAVQSNAWTPLFWDGHKVAHEQVNRHWQVVVSTPDTTYFDFPYAADPEERGYYWASRATGTLDVFEFMPDNLPAHAEFRGDREQRPMSLDDRSSAIKEQRRFYGLQGHLWTETTRTDAQADYMIFPRLIALAERAWHRPDWELAYDYRGALYNKDSQHFDQKRRQLRQRDWNRFANLLAQKELQKLDIQGVHYRVPTPGASIVDGKLHMKSPFPGLTMQYRLAAGEWKEYLNPIELTNSTTVEVRLRSADGARAGRSLKLMPTPSHHP
jgi:hexosaminidase